MQFLPYLTPQGVELYQMISRKVRVVENTPICRKHEIFGWYDNRSKTMTICTNRIIAFGNAEYYINETFYHESAHIAQACKTNMRSIDEFRIPKSAIKLSSRRLMDVENAVSLNGENVRDVEREAFWLEDKPDKVKYVVKKYCF